MSLLDEIGQQLGGDTMTRLAGQLGTDQQTTRSAVAMALPMLIGGLAQNTAQPEGARALGRALERDHDGSLLGNVNSFLGGEQPAAAPRAADGAGILGHVFGQRQSAVADGIGKATGMSSDQTRRLLTMLAPIVLGYLGSRMRQKKLEPQQIGAELQQEKAQITEQAPGMAGVFGDLLDRDKDGSITDDLARLAPNVLGGLFGGRKS
ncbi:MAG: DUF937 domain-containing protein [Gemmatimonadaceae bacterium]